jgi:deazaflavin-dependent oxidoreductase (nitroreductase family)
MNLLLKLFVKGHVALYTLSGGKLGQRMRGNDVIILSTRGAKTGALRRVPVVPLVEGDKLYVIASLGGAPRHPAWYHNMKANPDVEVQRGPARWRAKARVLPEPERTQVWQRVVATLPGFSEYQQKTSRVIPVVELVKT